MRGIHPGGRVDVDVADRLAVHGDGVEAGARIELAVTFEACNMVLILG